MAIFFNNKGINQKMDTSLFANYANAIRSVDLSTIRDADAIPESLQLMREGGLSASYIPFDWVNRDARIVIVGITPGFTQWQNAMREAQSQLKAGAPNEQALREAKRTGAFSGTMRPNLVALLDYFTLNRWLGIGSCSELFGTSSHLVQTTSALRYPVFVGGKNYNGAPAMTRTPVLKKMLLEYFAAEAACLPNAIFVPLGPKVSEALMWLATQGAIDGSRVLDGMPHPSGANAERIQYMLERKPKSQLSAKTNAGQLDAARERLRGKISALMAS